MSNPFRSFRYLPWGPLFQSAGLSVLVASALDIALQFAIVAVPAIARLFFSTPLLQLALSVAAAFGLGALAIVLTSQFFRQILLRADTIWALIGCVLLVLLVKSFIPGIPALFVRGPDYFSIMAVIVGAFTQGRHYWR
ncbi:MAG: hypothetical protein WBD47_12775 [Phormidesmis sp.]